jgi:hypothetical protein
MEYVSFGKAFSWGSLAIGHSLNMCQDIDCDEVGWYNGKSPLVV